MSDTDTQSRFSVLSAAAVPKENIAFSVDPDVQLGRCTQSKPTEMSMLGARGTINECA